MRFVSNVDVVVKQSNSIENGHNGNHFDLEFKGIPNKNKKMNLRRRKPTKSYLHNVPSFSRFEIGCYLSVVVYSLLLLQFIRIRTIIM